MIVNKEKIQAMRTGGKKLAAVREALAAAIKPGVTPLGIEQLAVDLIKKSGGEPAFMRVPKYHWATCINVNDVIVHGIPSAVPFKEGDLVSIDVGLFYKGYYTDTSVTVVAGNASEFQKKFMRAGEEALAAGITAAKAGNRVSHISKAIEQVLHSYGYKIIPELTGHGVGRQLHESPYIPNVFDPSEPSSILKEGQTIAIEPMYTTGSPRIVIDRDGWTIRIADGSPSGLVEHTIVITKDGPEILT
jgi:methionyl aminopeptidase